MKASYFNMATEKYNCNEQQFIHGFSAMKLGMFEKPRNKHLIMKSHQQSTIKQNTEMVSWN